MSSSTSPLKFIDIAVNLTDTMFRGVYRGKRAHADDFEFILQRAKDFRVSQILITGTDLESTQEAIQLSNQHNFFCTAGVHPTNAGKINELSSIREMLLNDVQHGRILAIGECGLDYDRLSYSTKEQQMACFLKHFELVKEFPTLPLFLHSRAAEDDFLNVIEKHRSLFPAGGVVHSFDGSPKVAAQLIAHDLYLGLNGCSLKTEANIETLKTIPIDRILIETDAPWCEVKSTHASFPFLKGPFSLKEGEGYQSIFPKSVKKERLEMGLMAKGRNEPCTIDDIINIIANVKEIDAQVLSTQIYRNTIKLFPSLDSQFCVHAAGK